ncbi:NADP-dependent oxidoreductase [Zoogloea sp.]|uniref:NADP-dependent oxidoreductase n=1 Tax=Zoogloea sp. TaxID=49181 RepID=UPI0035B26FB1
MAETNLKVVLASRPDGKPSTANFRVETGPLPEPAEGEVLVRNQWLSIDPYMRGRMMDIRTYAEPVALGDVMVGDTAGVVVASRHADFAVGDAVAGPLGWQRYGTLPGQALRRVDTARVPLSAGLGVAGMPGVTAWVGLMDLCAPQAGETVVVTAASGGVGGVAGQLARIAGCRVVGVAGGPDKCRHVVEDLGFDACLDYRAEDFRQQLKAAVPQGIDCIFDNVGGPVLDALVGRLKPFARVALCGAISEVDNPSPTGLRRLLPLIVNRVKLQGFIVGDHPARWPVAIDALSGHVAAGRIHYRETIADGLENAPQALLDLLAGRSLGKQLVRIT